MFEFHAHCTCVVCVCWVVCCAPTQRHNWFIQSYTIAEMHWIDFPFTDSADSGTHWWSAQFVRPSNDVDEKFYSNFQFTSEIQFYGRSTFLLLVSRTFRLRVSCLSCPFHLLCLYSLLLLCTIFIRMFLELYFSFEKKSYVLNVLQAIDGRNNWAVNVWIEQRFSCTFIFPVYLYSSVQIER